jgi:glutaconate CoA-transferase, subunit A
MLVAMGALDRIDIAYWPIRQVGGFSGQPGIDHSQREGLPRPMEAGGVLVTPKEKIKGDVPPVKVVDWTNFQISMRLMAGALNIPFMPNRSVMQTDIPKYNKEIIAMNDPFLNTPILLIPAYQPDVAFISVQRADRRGNGQIWGFRGSEYWKARAAKHVVLLTEQLVPTSKIYENAGLTVIPAYCTDAVIQLPFNCLPTGCYGCYTGEGLKATGGLIQKQTRDGYLKWIDEWIYGTKDHIEWCDKVGWEIINRLAKSENVYNRIPE